MASAQSNITRMLVGFPAGAGTDSIARAIAQQLNGTYAPTVIVENRAGAGGRLAPQALRGAAPDGRTLLFTPGAMMVVYPHIYSKLPYDPLTDFIPVTTATVYHFGIAVGPSVPESVRTLEDLVAWVKASKQPLALANPSAGSLSHFTGVLFARGAGIDVLHVPYNGTGPAMNAVLGGQVAAVVNVLGDFAQHVEGKRLRVLAASGTRRSQYLPNVPTFKELGYAGLETGAWVGFMLPVGTPPDVVEKLTEGVKRALDQEAVIKVFAQFGAEKYQVSGREFADLYKADYERWAGVVKSIGFKPQE